MVDGQIRRTLKRSLNVAGGSEQPSVGTVISVPGESRTVTDVDRSADTDDRNIDVESDSVKRIGVVEVNPEQLGDFIAERAGNRDGDGDGKRTRRKHTDSGIKRGKRGRKEAPQNVEALVTMVHTWASVLLKTPELMLAETEVKQLSDAYSTFCEYHEVPILTPKRMSEVNLIATVCIVYGTRIVAIKNRRKEERQNKGNVTPISNRQNVSH